MMQNYRIVLSYDGTDFHGWQRQPDTRTVQGVVEQALAGICSGKVSLIGAGRTDAGVHALGQAANFRVQATLDEAAFLRALNAVLPHDVRVLTLEKVPPEFHARKLARSKIYQYRICRSPVISPFLFRYVLHWPRPLKIHAMREAASLFVRKADFSAFSSNRLLNPVREVFRSEIRKRGDEILFTIEADGFLRYMVRTIVGTLLEVGRGRLAPEKIEEIFKKNDRSLAGPTAPARGLCLVKVTY